MGKEEREYIKRTQKDYPMSFKISVVREYEETEASLGALSRKYGIQGSHTVRTWINKFGTFDWQNRTLQPMAKSKEQELLELREKVRVLERKNARLEKELEVKDMKAEFFDLMIDIAEEEYGVDIRKKMLTRTVKRYTEMKPASISGVCRLLGISRQKYYRGVWGEDRSRQRATQAVSMVLGIRERMPRVGTRKLHFMLGNELKGIGVGRDRLFDILRANHMLVVPHRSYHVTTNSPHRFHKHKNLVAGLKIVRPEQVWVSDKQDMPHVSVAHHRRILQEGCRLQPVAEPGHGEFLKALRMANANRRYPNETLIHHSDRGIQYCSDAYQRLLGKYGIKTSKTESYDPYANAVAERVNGILKQEFLLEELDLPFKLMRKVISECVYIYNNLRPHLSCGYNTPEWMHSQRDVPVKTYKRKPPQGVPATVN